MVCTCEVSERRFACEARRAEKVSANLERREKVCIAKPEGLRKLVQTSKEGLHCEARRAEKVSANLEKKVCIAKPLPYTTNFISLKANTLTQPSFFVSN